MGDIKMNFDTLQHYVIFMRYKRSGSALLVNLLDAHQNIIFVRNEELYRKYPKWADDPNSIYDHLYTNSQRYIEKPFSANGYEYPIEGVGNVTKPIVIGHKSSTRNFIPMAEDPAKLQQFKDAVNLPLKFVHLVRNPYNLVGARWQQKEFRRINAPLGPIIDHLQDQVDANRKMKDQALVAETYHQLHLEDLIDIPYRTISGVCEYLEVEVNHFHINKSMRLIFKQDDVRPAPWTEANKDRIKQMIKENHDFFGRYETYTPN